MVAALACGATFDTAWSEALPAGADVTLPPGSYAGPWRFGGGVRIHGAGVTLTPAPDGGATLEIIGAALIDGLAIIAPKGGMGVRVEAAGEAELRGVAVSGPAEALVYVAEGALTLSGGQLTGAEYGLLTEKARALQVRNVRVSQQARAGLAVVNGPAEVADNQLWGPFGEAAISVLHGKLTLARNRITSAGAIGIKIVNGEATLEDDTVAGARTDRQGLEGNGLYVYDSKVGAARDHFSDCQGAALSLIQSTTTLTEVVIEEVAETAIYASGGRLMARGCLVRRSPAGLLLEKGSEADETGFRFEHVANPVVHLAP